MWNYKSKLTVTALWLAAGPLYGGTGRPGDGFLSFILLLGFLLLILGILQMIFYLRRWICEMREDIF